MTRAREPDSPQFHFSFSENSVDVTTVAQFPLSRANDPDTSKSAGRVVESSLSALQELVLKVYDENRPMSARDAERRTEFAEWSANTIRKRISELSRAGLLVSVGVDGSRHASITIWSTPGWIARNPTSEIVKTHFSSRRTERV